MSNEKNGVLVNVLKKAVGIPSGNSSCCGPAPAANGGCCDSTPAAKESPDAKAEGSCCGR